MTASAQRPQDYREDSEPTMSIPGQRNSTKDLRPWNEVARLFEEKSGIPICPQVCRETHARALNKIRKAIEESPEDWDWAMLEL